MRTRVEERSSGNVESIEQEIIEIEETLARLDLERELQLRRLQLAESRLRSAEDQQEVGGRTKFEFTHQTNHPPPRPSGKPTGGRKRWR